MRKRWKEDAKKGKREETTEGRKKESGKEERRKKKGGKVERKWKGGRKPGNQGHKKLEESGDQAPREGETEAKGEGKEKKSGNTTSVLKGHEMVSPCRVITSLLTTISHAQCFCHFLYNNTAITIKSV